MVEKGGVQNGGMPQHQTDPNQFTAGTDLGMLCTGAKRQTTCCEIVSKTALLTPDVFTEKQANRFPD